MCNYQPACNLTYGKEDLKRASYHPVVAGNHGANNLNVEVNWNEERRSD